ncbi:NACHT domain-containing protein [Nocardia sp. SYP-A9097]|uniref:NACHT domain-containing protein n=1 Tax=Nocardia sp. SYP-A9097 TaxID=2663237 RepID=UPI00129A48FC|nr:NACHT domain-containing protein [Nocardia sp. SYP-A9097]MRH88278.1 NACHT domain-containing protein [Nocardia sp. SYP-A9097]
MAEEDSITQGLTGLLGGFGGGVIVAGVLAIALKKLGDKLGEGMYGLLTALPRRALERIAVWVSEDKRITHYRAKIPDEYGRHVLTKQRQVTVDSVYIHLQYERAGRRHDLRRRVLEEKAVLLLGEAGAGKSLLSKYFLLQWAEQPRKLQREQQLPVLVELHRCDGSVDLASLIASRFRLPHDKDDSRAKDFVTRRLNEGALRLLFDGLDEVNPDQQSAVIDALEVFRRTYASGEEANAIVVTCRSSAYNGSLGAFELIRISDFDDSSILRFLDRWLTLERSAHGGLTEAELTELGSAERLFEQIRQNPQLHQLARTPLLLSLLADLYTGSLLRRGRSLPSSRAAFYSRVTDHMVTRDLLLHRAGRASPYEPGEKLAVLKRIARTMTETPAADGDRLNIDHLRLREVMTEALTSLDLRTEHGRELLRDLTDRTQLLVGSDTGERFWFPHRSFQEYFTARALEGPVGAGRLLTGYWSDPPFWRDSVRFWCGLDGNDSTIVVERLFDSDDITHRVLALECLAEASQIDSRLADRILAHFLAELPTIRRNLGLDGIVDALGSVAARDTDRGSTLRAELQIGSATGVFRAMRVLARSGRPDAAQFLVDLAVHENSRRARICVETMGEVAVPALAGVVSDHRLWPIDALGAIGTPSAALRLTELLWRDGESAIRAAWWICVLLREPNIEAALQDNGSIGVPELTTIDAAWIPFTTPESRLLPRIMQRITAVVDSSFPPADLRRELDPRVAILLIGRMFVRVRNVASGTYPTLSMEYSKHLARRESAIEFDAQLSDFLTELGVEAPVLEMIRALPLSVQRKLAEELLETNYDASSELRWAPLWSRAALDAEHNTRRMTLFLAATVSLAAVSLPGIGVVRMISTINRSWAWGPLWLAWTMLVLPVCTLAGLGAGWYLMEHSTPLPRERLPEQFARRGTIFTWRDDILVPLIVGGVGGTLLLGGLLAVPGTVTLAAWIGWIPVLIGTPVLLVFCFALNYTIERLNRETDNPFRAIIQEYRRSRDPADEPRG